MHFEQFTKEILARTRKQHPACEVECRSREGKTELCIFRKNWEVFPVMDLEYFFDCLKAKTMKMEEIEKIVFQSIEKAEKYPEGLQKMHTLHALIEFHVSSLQSARQYLSYCPYRLLTDLVLTYHLRLPSSTGVSLIGILTNERMYAYGLIEEQLYKLAMEYAPVNQPAVCYENLAWKEDPFDMICVTNDRKSYGAASLFYPKVLDYFAKKYTDGFYIIPSSVHEVIILYQGEVEVDEKDYVSIIQNCNQKWVIKEDRLPAHLYYYTPSSHVLKCCDASEEYCIYPNYQ